jgi:hypothetical protein
MKLSRARSPEAIEVARSQRISGYEVLRAGNQILELIREQVARRMQELGWEWSKRQLAPASPRPLSLKRGEGR